MDRIINANSWNYVQIFEIMNPFEHFQTIGKAPATPSAGQTTLEFINSASCPVSVDPKSFFRVNLNYGEVRRVPDLSFSVAEGEFLE